MVNYLQVLVRLHKVLLLIANLLQVSIALIISSTALDSSLIRWLLCVKSINWLIILITCHMYVYKVQSTEQFDWLNLGLEMENEREVKGEANKI